MKKLFALSVILVLASVPSFASKTQPAPSSQLRLKRPHSLTAKAGNKTANKTPLHRHSAPEQNPSWLARPAISSHIPSQYVKPRKSSSNTTTPTPVGFVTAVDFPLGGVDDDATLSVTGDFNGDGKPDAAKLVYTPGDSPVYSISVILNNGTGGFQAAQLTPTANNTDDPIVVGDVNGDGKDDIVMIHPSNGDIECGGDVARRKSNSSARPNDCVPASFDVYLSNGDGTFTLGDNYLISEWALNGGILTQLSNGNLGILAVDSEDPGLVISVLGNGDGTFAAPTTFATLSGPAPYGIFFADFNGDGSLDFAGEVENQIVVYLATSSGFAAPVSLITSDGNYDSCFNASGDLTGSGVSDIVSVNCEDENSITVYLNKGSGSFQTGFYYRNAGDYYTDPYGVAIADVNGDGSNDVIVSNPESGLITVFLNKGDGSLNVPTIAYDTGGYPWNPVLVANFTGDGLADLLVPDDDFSFVLLPGYGDGTFRAAPNYFQPNSYDSGAYTYSVATGDFNGDGFADVVAGQDFDGGVVNPGIIVYLSNPDGSLQPGVYYGNSPTFGYVTVGDFNKDGNLDIAATDYYNGVVQIFLGNGDGTFTPGLSYPTDTNENPWPRNVITADLNNDGKLDLAIANQETGTVGILFGNGDGTFGALADYELSGYPYALAAADLNGDGYLDLAMTIATDSPNNIAILLNHYEDNAGVFAPETDVAIGSGIPEYIALGDLNGDGKIDMVVSLNEAATYPSSLVVALGNGNGTFQAPIPYASTAQEGGMAEGWVANVQMADMNGDGNLDLVYLNGDFGTVGVMLGNGDGTFGTPVEFPTSEYVWGMALADITNAGVMDVVTGNDESGGVSVLLNSAGSTTVPNYTIATQNPIVAVAQGSTATYNLTLTGTNLYNGTITLACSGLPTATTCTFTPASVVAQGNVPQATVLTITTTAAPTTTTTTRLRRSSSSGAPTFLASLAGLGLFGLVMAGGGKKRNRIRGGILLGMVLLGMMFTMFGCSSSHAAPPPPPVVTPLGSYTVVVTATGTGATAPTQTLNITLVVD